MAERAPLPQGYGGGGVRGDGGREHLRARLGVGDGMGE